MGEGGITSVVTDLVGISCCKIYLNLKTHVTIKRNIHGNTTHQSTPQYHMIMY